MIKASKKNQILIRRESEKAVLIGLARLQEILQDPSTLSADVFKGLTLLFDRIYRPDEGGGAPDGFEIRLTP